MTADEVRLAGTVHSDPLVRIEETFDAPRERVFDAWVRPDRLAQWYAPRGCTLHIEDIDVRTGGSYHMCIRDPEFGDCWTIGTYLEVARPTRLAFTAILADVDGFPVAPESQGHDPAWPSETLVRVTFAEDDGRTVVTLEQDVSEASARRTGAYPSWLEMLDRLGQHLSGGPR